MSADPLLFVADRLAISDLVQSYAQLVDRREPDAVAQLFTEDATFVAYTKPGASEPTTSHAGRAAIAEAMGTMLYYQATTHTIAHHLATVGGDRGTGETRCVAHHVLGDAGSETLLVWHLRYLDDYSRTPEGWRFHRRVLRIDIVSDQPLRSGAD